MKKLYLKPRLFITLVLICNSSFLFAGVIPSRTTTPPDNMEVDLSVLLPGGAAVVDGILISYHPDYLAEVDFYDATKMYNTEESIAFLRDGYALCIERRPSVADRDTQFINMVHMVIGNNYRLEFLPSFVTQGMTAYLQDSYNPDSLIAISTETNSSYDFSVTSDPATSAANRFRIVLIGNLVPSPITFSGLRAYAQNQDINLEWNVDNETIMKQYEVERSADGLNFTKVYTAIALNRMSGAYHWLDVNPAIGNNYYRIRSVDITATTKYSTIVKVVMDNPGTAITVYPTLVTGSTINIQFAGMDKGNYTIRLINTMGRVVSGSTYVHHGGNATSSIQKGSLERGKYYLEIIHPDNTRTLKGLMIAD